eukprot:8750215-Pyramimonas_sp.AAC.1
MARTSLSAKAILSVALRMSTWGTFAGPDGLNELGSTCLSEPTQQRACVGNTGNVDNAWTLRQRN